MSVRTSVALFSSVAFASVALADIEFHTGFVDFTSDAQPPDSIVLPSFNNMGGTRTLQSVIVELCHEGSVDISADNDDPFKPAQVRARMIRQWDLTGPDVIGFGSKTINSAIENLTVDDGDGGDNNVFDASPADGVTFPTLTYSNLSAGVFNPLLGLYDTAGPGSVQFDVTPTLMVNDLVFVGVSPDAWQLMVENPQLRVIVKLTYEYIPTPGAAALLGVAGLASLRRRRA